MIIGLSLDHSCVQEDELLRLTSLGHTPPLQCTGCEWKEAPPGKTSNTSYKGKNFGEKTKTRKLKLNKHMKITRIGVCYIKRNSQVGFQIFVARWLVKLIENIEAEAF